MTECIFINGIEITRKYIRKLTKLVTLGRIVLTSAYGLRFDPINR